MSIQTFVWMDVVKTAADSKTTKTWRIWTERLLTTEENVLIDDLLSMCRTIYSSCILHRSSISEKLYFLQSAWRQSESL